MTSNEWRSPTDRTELVEALVRSEARNRLLEAELRARVVSEEKYLAGHPELSALMAENRELRQIIERQNAKIQRRRAS